MRGDLVRSTLLVAEREVMALLRSKSYLISTGILLVAILGGFVWKRATGAGALWSMGVGTAVTLGTMVLIGDVLANEPIYFGLAASLLVYVVASLMTPRTPPEVLQVWDDRLAGRDEPAKVTAG